MRARAHVGAALLALLLMIPGTTELVVDAVHWIADGHTAHDASTGHHDDGPADEHGCSGPYHFCTCHGSAQYVAPAPARASAEEPRRSDLATTVPAPAPSTHLDRLFRPPIA